MFISLFNMSLPPTFLSELNGHPRDKLIFFEEEGHKYTIDGQQDYVSVTTLIAKLFEHFDANKIIDNMFKNPIKMADPKNKYFGMSKQDILNLWSENGKKASELGTKMHNNIEKYFNNVDVVDDSVEYGYFNNFLKDFPDLVAKRTEWCVFSKDHKICGSIDMVFQNTDGTISIYDWKRVKEISYEPFGNKKCLVPGLENIPDTSFYHYQIQLSLYKFLLEKYYDLKVRDLHLVVMHPDASNYERIPVPMMDEEIEIIMDWWHLEKTKQIIKH